MKIAFFHHSLRLGSGIDTVIYELANRLARKGDNVTVFCFETSYKKESCNFQIEEIKSRFANTMSRKMVIAPFILDKFGPLNSYLKKFDVINTHLNPANYIVRNIRGPLNVVTEWSVSGSTIISSSIKLKLYLKWVLPRLNKIAVRKADAVLVASEFVRNWVVQNYAVHPVMMYLDGINFELFDRFTSSTERLYKKYPAIEGKKIILFVGRITDHKNIHSLLEVFSIVKRKISHVVLILVGDYEHYLSYYARLLELVRTKHLERDVIFAGVVSWEDLPSYYSACTIYATCTLWEGFLRAESYAFGKPIICFNVSSLSETVRDGERGFLIEDLNVQRFAEKMYDLLSDDSLSRKMGENGYRWAKKNLDFDSITERFRLFCQERLDREPLSRHDSFDTTN